MIYEVSEGKESTRVELHETGENHYEVKIDGETLHVDVTKSARTIYSVIEDGRQYEAMVDERRGDRLDISLGGRMFHLDVVDERTRLLAEAGSSAPTGPQTVAADMPGKIVKIEAAVGQTVSEGEVILIIEAMKMENPIASPIDGVVKELGAAEGDAVDGGAMLFTVAPVEAA
ncbi:MAG: biotin/lipoyl-binding protein [Myxococcales bacterium]|nr:biotin/lipoyl-binding protein [Myxococcales bacterium]